MIAMLQGQIDSISDQSVILDIGGVGYRVFVAASVLVGLSEQVACKFYTYHHIREDDQRLFGFPTLAELELFVKFLTVDGVGPKVALAIFSTYSYAQICDGLYRGDDRFFAAVSGLGKKTAAKIVLELKGSAPVGGSLQSSKTNNDVVDALVALGYAEKDVISALQNIDISLSQEHQIKEALRKLAQV